MHAEHRSCHEAKFTDKCKLTRTKERDEDKAVFSFSGNFDSGKQYIHRFVYISFVTRQLRKLEVSSPMQEMVVSA